jgi:DNA-binding GntR family transcriptional regulator
MSIDGYLAGFAQTSPTVAEAISRVLRQAVLDGALPGGTVIRQEQMAKKFGVSRVPIREALLKLEGEGLVETQPRKGVVVTALSADDFEEILEMRFALESLALDLAAPKFRPADAESAMEIVNRAQTLLQNPETRDRSMEFETRWGELNAEFHRRLYRPAGRPRLQESIENLQHLFARHVRARFGAMESTPCPVPANLALPKALVDPWAHAIDEHRQMVLACEANNARAAKAILREHIAKNGAKLLADLRSSAVAAPGRAS